MGEVISVSFERCAYCRRLFRPGEATITSIQGERVHARSCLAKYYDEKGPPDAA